MVEFSDDSNAMDFEGDDKNSENDSNKQFSSEQEEGESKFNSIQSGQQPQT